MGVEELSGGAANAAIATSANRPPETVIFGMEPRTIGLPQSAAIPDALDYSLEFNRFAGLAELVQRAPLDGLKFRSPHLDDGIQSFALSQTCPNPQGRWRQPGAPAPQLW